LGHFLPVIILSPDWQVRDAKRHFGKRFSIIEIWPAAFIAVIQNALKVTQRRAQNGQKPTPSHE